MDRPARAHDAAQREAARHDAAQREAARHDAAQREAARHDAAQREAARRDAAQREAARRDAARRDAAPRTATLATGARPRRIEPRFDPAPTPPHDLSAGLAAALPLLRGRGLVALTGAGISTDSGIPDYRGPQSPPRRPMTYEQFVTDAAFRRTYWARNHVGWRHVHRTSPNDGHRALARLEEAGVVVGVITQNVDRLHALAGSRSVIDLHGTYAEVVCLDCGHRVSRDDLAHRLEALNPGFAEAVGSVADVEIAPDADAVVESTEGFRVADCERCGGLLKPDIVYFGEAVPRERVERAYSLVDAADAVLVAGSSLAVMSGLRFVRHAARAGKPVVIVNRGATRGDALADVRIHAGTTETLTALAEELAVADGA